MATRFYLPNSGAADVSPTANASFAITTGFDRVKLQHKNDSHASTTTLTDKTLSTVITTSQSYLNRMFVSEPMLPYRFTTQSIFSIVNRGLTSVTTVNGHLAYSLRIMSNDGLTSRGTLASNFAAATVYVASAATRIFGNGTTTVACTAVTMQSGDRLVFEIGVFCNAPTTAGTATQRFGNSATSDFALTNALITDLNTWFELSDNLFTPSNNNYQGVKVGNGMSTSSGRIM